jgi:hypothetical protein
LEYSSHFLHLPPKKALSSLLSISVADFEEQVKQ